MLRIFEKCEILRVPTKKKKKNSFPLSLVIHWYIITLKHLNQHPYLLINKRYWVLRKQRCFITQTLFVWSKISFLRQIIWSIRFECGSSKRKILLQLASLSAQNIISQKEGKPLYPVYFHWLLQYADNPLLTSVYGEILDSVK